MFEYSFNQKIRFYILALSLLLITGCGKKDGPNEQDINKDAGAGNGGLVSADIKDANQFLTFLNNSADRNNESQSTGEAYYRAADPRNKRLTLDAFKSFTYLTDNEVAVYVNDADLGFGRRMYVQVNKNAITSRTTSVASCVENYAPLVNNAPDVNAADDIKLNLAIQANPADIVATVCMEFSGTPGSADLIEKLTGRKFVKFFSYDNTGKRIVQADLDGRGLKSSPGLCNSCHGGQGNSLSNGVYLDKGFTGAQFLPWDLTTFKYSSRPGYSRSEQEPIFKRFNQAVLETYEVPQTFSSTEYVPLTSNTVGLVSASSSISVNMTDPVTSITLSIDAGANGGPGIVNSLSNFVMVLSAPKNINRDMAATNFKTLYPIKDYTGIKNLYLSDDAAKYFIEKPIDNIFSGNIVMSKVVPFVFDFECPNGFDIPRYGFSCINASGDWTLKITDYNTNFSGAIVAWSIHFNGIPDGSYIPAAVELIRGWYGGIDANRQLINATFDDNYIPPGWRLANNPNAVANPETLYLKVIAPTCRACHAQRGTLANNDLDFSTYKKFMKYAKRTQNMVYDRGLMPMAKRTYESHFWKKGSNMPEILAQHLPDYIAGQDLLTPGRNIANAGIARIGKLAVLQNQIVTLNGNGSLFPKGFDWTVTAPDGSPVQLIINAEQAANPSFKLSQVGMYHVQLDTSGSDVSNSNSIATNTIESSSTARPKISFIDEVLDFYQKPDPGSSIKGCAASNCHLGRDAIVGRNRTYGRLAFFTRLNFRESIDVHDLQRRENYRIIRDRVDTLLPLESLMIRKGRELIDHGSIGSSQGSNPRVSKSESDYPPWLDKGDRPNFPDNLEKQLIERYDIFLRWVLEGADYN